MSDERKRPKRTASTSLGKLPGSGSASHPASTNLNPARAATERPSQGLEKRIHDPPGDPPAQDRDPIRPRQPKNSDFRRHPTADHRRCTEGNTKSATFVLNRYAALVSGELQARTSAKMTARCWKPSPNDLHNRTTEVTHERVRSGFPQRGIEERLRDLSAPLLFDAQSRCPFIPNWHHRRCCLSSGTGTGMAK